ncbi:hypothetical protein Tco_1090895 [Tanacetum coccineum]|uniref:Uncharacterized protein n=1 Tax=Tanacetum coccineum TaxID=301880 RepID=A0ABQ5I7V3_9ASTR
MEDAELINDNRIPINVYSEAFLCHMGISRNYFQSLEEVPTFIGDDGQEIDLFSVVRLNKPKMVTEGVRPLREGEEPLMEATAGYTMELVLAVDHPEDVNTMVEEPVPLRSVPDADIDPQERDLTSADISEAAADTKAKGEIEEVNFRMKRKRSTSGDGSRSSKKVRHVIFDESSSTEEETMGAPSTTAAKDFTESSPPNVEATGDTYEPVTHVKQSPPKSSPFISSDPSWGDQEPEPKVFVPKWDMPESSQLLNSRECAVFVDNLTPPGRRQMLDEMPVDQLMDELNIVQLADARIEAESANSYAHKLAEEKMSLLVKVDQERAGYTDYKTSCLWVLKYLERAKEKHFAMLDDFRQKVEELLEKWLISHGLRLATMCSLESQEVKQVFRDVVKCALARGKAEAVEELHEQKLLTVPAKQVPGYNKDTYKELIASMERMKVLELPHIARLERYQDYPIDVIMAGLTLARHTTENAEAQPNYFLKPDVAQLQEDLEAHAMRLAKKEGVKGKAILCGVGAAHIPRSDGIPVSVATVSPKDGDLLRKLEGAGESAYQVCDSEQGHCHSV